MKGFLLALFALPLLGCATQTLYNWGEYENSLYESYKYPAKVEALRTSLELHIQAMEAAGRKVAPGLYAELGTLYLQAGANEQAVGMYKSERNAWPESAGLMDVLIRKIEERMEQKGKVGQ